MKNARSQQGYTLIEVIIAIAITGIITAGTVGLGNAIISGNDNRQFENECEKVLAEVLLARNDSMMQGDSSHYISITFTRSYIDIKRYYEERGKYLTKRIPLEHCTLAGSLYNKELRFLEVGTVSQGGNIAFLKNGKPEKYLIVQIGNGRVYLTDVKPT